MKKDKKEYHIQVDGELSEEMINYLKMKKDGTLDKPAVFNEN